jgi:hypothetical protein
MKVLYLFDKIRNLGWNLDLQQYQKS